MHRIINNLIEVGLHGKNEFEYFESIVSYIKTSVDYTFVFTAHDRPIGEVAPNTIVFSASDEHHNQPIADHLQKNVLLVFKNYYPKEPVCDGRVFPFPLGYMTGFRGNCSIPLLNRELDYSFVGTFNGNGREKMLQQLQARQDDGRKKFWTITNSWGKGLSMEDYGKLLSHTKIALCPSGYVSRESFRIFEAAKCGCVLIVDDVPTNLWYYDGFPGIIVKDWSDLSVIEQLLNDSDAMNHIGKNTADWYERCISPQSVAAYVQTKINEVTT
jgi:glycosyltransferase involved in cell wall biosynthesis